MHERGAEGHICSIQKIKGPKQTNKKKRNQTRPKKKKHAKTNKKAKNKNKNNPTSKLQHRKQLKGLSDSFPYEFKSNQQKLMMISNPL